jgi:hypothetical protein
MIPGSANPLLLTSADSGYAIERSLRFNSGDSAYLNRTPSAAGNRKTWTWSGWVKRSALGSQYDFASAGDSGNYVRIAGFNSSDKLELRTDSAAVHVVTEQVFRDCSAWYHIVIAFDTTQSTASNRTKFYVNGSQVTSLSTTTYPGQNTEHAVNNTGEHRVGAFVDKTSATVFYPFNGYLADVHFIDGQALAPTDFGETDDNGVWQPKAYTGNYNISNITYSNYLSAPGGFASGEGATNAFDGSTSTRTKVAVADSIITFDLSSLNLTGSFEFYATNAASEYSLDGGTTWTSSAANSYTTATSDISGVSNIKLKSASGTTMKVTAFKNQGFVLVDNSGTNSFHLDFADNSSNAALGTDTSGNSNTWTVNNLTALVPSTYGIDFDGNDKVVFPGTTFTGDCTIECFVKASSYSGIKRIFSANEGTNSGEYTDLRAYNGTHEFYFGTGSYVSDNGTTIPTNVWNHIALTRSGSTVSYYMNGTRLATDSLSGSVLCTSLVLAHGYGSEYFTGQISNARVVNGQALYTGASYTVPTADLTTTSQGATASNVTHLLANTSSATANGGTGSAGTAGGDPSVISVSTFGGPADIDSLVDTPTNAAEPSDTGAGGEFVGNYATLNPLKKANITTSNGNLDFTHSGSTGSWQAVFSTIGMSSEKYYCEFTCKDSDSVIGIAKDSHTIANDKYVGNDPNGWGYNGQNGSKINNSSGSSYGNSYTSGDVIGIAFDADGGNLYFYKNGAVQNSGTAAYTGLTDGPYFFAFSLRDTGNTPSVNFGQRAFANSSVPSGYKSLNTANLPEPTIADSGKYFDTKLWTGNASSKAITGYNFSPDFVWIKNRSGAYHHGLFDIVRGANKVLISSNTNAETTYTQQLNSFDSSGFTLGDNSDSGNYVNVNNSTYVGWAWDAGSSNTTIAAGSLNSSVYNQSQSAWQNYLTTTNGNGFPDSNHPVTWAFDGHLNHHTYTGDDDIYFTPSGGVSFTITSQVRIRSYWDTTVTVETSAGTFGPVTSSSSGTWQWTTVSCSGTLTKITIRRVNGANLSGIEIDGILLVNSGITPATNVPSIASTVRASASSGFSIVSYNGTGANATLGHGLNAAPEFVIVKTRTSGSINWTVWHEAIAATDYLTLNTSNAKGTAAAVWNSTAPTSSVINVGTDVGTNKSGDNYIAYCFAPVEGYSAMGSYTGNNSADGPFVYTGFKPRWIMIKATSFSEHWYIYDTKRNPFNVNQYPLLANSSNGGLSYEGIADGGQAIDILSNGFKLRGAWLTNNGSQNYIYAAFAENPFKNARAR